MMKPYLQSQEQHYILYFLGSLHQIWRWFCCWCRCPSSVTRHAARSPALELGAIRYIPSPSPGHQACWCSQGWDRNSNALQRQKPPQTGQSSTGLRPLYSTMGNRANNSEGNWYCKEQHRELHPCSKPLLKLAALTATHAQSAEWGDTAQVCCKSIDPLSFLHVMGI